MIEKLINNLAKYKTFKNFTKNENIRNLVNFQNLINNLAKFENI